MKCHYGTCCAVLADLLASLLARGNKLRDAMIVSSLDTRPSSHAQTVDPATVQRYAYTVC